jgi:PAS domain-containing protein
LFDTPRSEGGVVFESRHRHGEGGTFPFEISITHVELRDGPRFYCSVRDITARRQEEAQRRLLEQAIKAVENGIIITVAQQPDHPIVFVNHGFTEMTGIRWKTRSGAIADSCRARTRIRRPSRNSARRFSTTRPAEC